ncbi:MAG: polymer-forming cytoskeletal protein [Spirochaetaceae bacterium]|jgi:cytoskeletal protein CcmA (bactofilin family)|nr:polymer-forming cytoskeletal protein [Spirochaetaceae bacterium]
MFDIKDIDLYELEDEDFDTIMADDIVFKGTIRFAKPFMIRGEVSGIIETPSDLVVDSHAAVYANITADRILVRGIVEGSVTAKRLVVVTAEGSVLGNITSAQVVLEPGSSFTGKCTMVKS